MPAPDPSLRGRCYEMAQAEAQSDPSLHLIRGWYFCPIWNVEEQHWWTKTGAGEIVDPTAAQYPSNGHGTYREFTGTFECEQCGHEVDEADLHPSGNSVLLCSGECFGRMVGVL